MSPKGNEILVGEIAIETGDADVTVNCVEPVIAPTVAVIVVIPPDTAFAKPAVGVMVLTVAAAGFDELHDADPVRFCVLLSLKVPVAVNC